MIRIAASALAALGFSHAATIVDLDSTDPSNGQQVLLDAGTYTVSFIANDFTSWNAWSRVTDCDQNGENCSRGWLTNTQIQSASLGAVNFGNFGRYATALDALAAAGTFEFTLASQELVTFLINDSNYSDNQGGVSLQIEAAAVPVPAAGILFGMAAAGYAARRKRG